jgi:uncharacterized protein involved in exopolysaccharide biosynthesis
VPDETQRVDPLASVAARRPIPAHGNGDVYLFETLREVWRRRWFVVGVTSACALTAVVAVLLQPSWYRADALLVPAQERSPAALAGQLGGLASLTGLSFISSSDAEAVAAMKSRDLTRVFIEENNLLPVLFAEEWDPVAGTWRSTDPERQPDLRDAVQLFERQVRTVSQDRASKLVTLSIEWTDPRLAAEWANSLVDRLNDHMRRRALAEAEANVEYLRTELDTTTAVALQQSIGRLLETELQKLMLARGTKDFAFRVIDRAEAPKRRSRPNRPMFVILATLAGGALSVLFVMIQGAQPRHNTPDSSGA